jgi:transcriptional regulator GlxA family with amidase domain
MTRRIGILGYDGIQALDLVGPAETFAAVPARADGAHEYEIVVIGLGRGKRFTSETGLTLTADTGNDTRLKLDTLIVPGGRAMRTPALAAAAASFIKARVDRIRRVASVCTGAYGLAQTGLLDGRRVATHWRFATDLQRRFPKLRVDADALFIKDGPFYTSAGISAGVDLSLALIEEDCGPRVALGVARELVVYLKRPGGQRQFSEPLQYQLRSADRFADLVGWLDGALDEDLSVTRMAERVFLSPRQFTRAFTAAFGMAPAAFVENLRLREATDRLSARRASVATVARSVGYASADVFRRAFERKFGIAPLEYRRRFASA